MLPRVGIPTVVLVEHKEDPVELLVADVGEVLLGPWTMILVAGAAFAGLAVGLPVAIIKTFGLIEGLVGRSGERVASRPERARSPDRLRRPHRTSVPR
jgi:hypothetical protein